MAHTARVIVYIINIQFWISDEIVIAKVVGGKVPSVFSSEIYFLQPHISYEFSIVFTTEAAANTAKKKSSCGQVIKYL
jgi:hypothetical protein